MNKNGGLQRPKFPLGQVVATPAALTALESTGETPQVFLARHWQMGVRCHPGARLSHRAGWHLADCNHFCCLQFTG